jgi:hypothetical protein
MALLLCGQFCRTGNSASPGVSTSLPYRIVEARGAGLARISAPCPNIGFLRLSSQRIQGRCVEHPKSPGRLSQRTFWGQCLSQSGAKPDSLTGVIANSDEGHPGSERPSRNCPTEAPTAIHQSMTPSGWGSSSPERVWPRGSESGIVCRGFKSCGSAGFPGRAEWSAPRPSLDGQRVGARRRSPRSEQR